MEQLYLQIYIGSMALIPEFFSAFGNATDEPSKPETELCVRFMAFMLDTVYRLAPEKRAIFEAKLPELVAQKIHNELQEYTSTPADQIKDEIISMAKSYSTEPTQETKLVPVPLNSLVEYVCVVSKNLQPGFKAYVQQRIQKLIEDDIPFEQLVKNAVI